MNLRKYLVPSFLKRLDHTLLTHQPVIWRTKIHYFIFYVLIVNILLFAIGALLPINSWAFYYDSEKLDKHQGFAFTFIALLALLMLIFWWNHLSRFKIRIVKAKDIVLEWCIYLVCVFMLITSVFMFELGVLYNEAYLAPKKIDETYSYLKAHDYFRMTYVPHHNPNKHKDWDTYFKEGETLLRLVLDKTGAKPFRDKLESANSIDGVWENEYIALYPNFFGHWQPQRIVDSCTRYTEMEKKIRQNLYKFNYSRSYSYNYPFTNRSDFFIYSSQFNFKDYQQLILDLDTLCLLDASYEPSINLFENANERVISYGSDAIAEYFNYFIGNDKSKWASKVKAYHQLDYSNLYNGIHLKVSSKENSLKYIYEVEKGKYRIGFLYNYSL